MPLRYERIIELVIAHLKGELSPEDRAVLVAWINEHPENRSLVEAFLDERQLKAGIAETYEAGSRIWEDIEKRLTIQRQTPVITAVKKRRVAVMRRWYGVVASIIIILGIGLYRYMSDAGKPTTVSTDISANIQAPDVNRAVITLADGRCVFLDSAANGALAQQGNTSLVKLANGQIAYRTADGTITRDPGGYREQYNTLTNPNGSRVVNMTLSDGTRVWLNAGSSLKYPVTFAGNERNVEVTGEAYFEVAHNQQQPFIVSRKEAMTVRVLGTKFNVNTYEDEPDLRVTLVEGSVKVNAGTGNAAAAVLRPGEQAVIDQQRKLSTRTHVDLDEVMAWREGYFKFNNSDLRTVMRQISRWYDVEVVFEQQVPQKQFVGTIPKRLDLKTVLKIIEENNIHYEFKNNRIVIKP